MIEILDGLVPSAATSLLIGTMAKGAALLSAALILVWFCGTRHALWKSLLLRSAVVGMLLLPVGAVMLTPIHLPLFADDSGFLQPAREDPDLLAGPSPAGIETSGVSTAADAAGVLVVVYGLGILVMLVRLARSALLASAVRGSVSRITAAHVLRRWRAWKWRLDVRRDLALAQSTRVATPTQLGIVDPMVVLPAGMLAEASSETLDMVLAHELAHVRGHDCLFRLLSMLVRAIYWPIPLAWMATGQLVKAQEQVCDDWAVKATGDPNGYAGSLLDIASQAQGRLSFALGLEMAKGSRVLERAERVAKSGGKVLVRVNGVASLAAIFVLTAYFTTVAALRPTARTDVLQIDNQPAFHRSLEDLAKLPVRDMAAIRPLAGTRAILPAVMPRESIRTSKRAWYHDAVTDPAMSVADLAELPISAPSQRRYGSTSSPLSVDLAVSSMGEGGYVRPVRIRGMGSGEDWRHGLSRRSSAVESGVDQLGRPLARIYEGAPRLRDPYDVNKVVVLPLEHQAGH